MDKRKTLVILGAGFQGRHIANMVSDKGNTYNEIILLDDNEDLWDQEFDGNKVLGPISQIEKEKFLGIPFVVGVGMYSMKARKKIFCLAEKWMKPVNIMHQTSFYSEHASIGKGSVLFPNSVVNPNVKIGRNCVLYSGAIVDHNSILHDNVWISTGVSIAGNVIIGEDTFIGIGATIIHNIRIGKNCVVAAGAVVLNDIPDNLVVFGNPARPIRKKVLEL